jgi:alpha-1,6-mannosyltransferase
MARQPVVSGPDDAASAGVAGVAGAGTTDAAPPVPLRGFAVFGLVATTAILCGVVFGGTAFVSRLPGAWFFGTPGGPLGSLGPDGTQPPAVAVIAVYGGMALLVVTWLRLLRTLWRHPGVAVRRVVGVVTTWAVPILVAPPLFSRDVYSYAGQGEMVSHHINPYLYGPGVLGATPFSDLAGQLWSNTPSPYGPTFLSLDGLAARLADHQVLADLAVLRLLAVVGVALIVAGLPTLARAGGRDAAAVVVLGAGSPLVVTTLVGGAHNDALMVGLLICGLAVARRVGPVPGIVLCALAAGVKAPALVGVVFIGWCWPGAVATVRARVERTLLAVGIAGATLAVLSWVSGLGWGWVGTISAESKVSTGVTPVDAVAHLVTDAAHVVGWPVGFGAVRVGFAAVGLLAAAVITTVLLWRSPRIGVVRAVGLSLLVFALLSPVLWAWYASWGLVVLAPVAAGRLRRAVIAITVVEAVIGISAVDGMAHTLASAGVVDDLLIVFGLVAVVLVAILPFRDYDGRSLVRTPWSGQRADQPAGVTVTAAQRPQAAQ